LNQISFYSNQFFETVNRTKCLHGKLFIRNLTQLDLLELHSFSKSSHQLSDSKLLKNKSIKNLVSESYTLRSLGVNFINVLGTNFSYEHCFSSFFYVHVTREKLLKQRSYEKFASKMLTKLTPDWPTKLRKYYAINLTKYKI